MNNILLDSVFSVWAPITKMPESGWCIKKRILFPKVLKAESLIRLPAWLGPGEGPLPGCRLLTSYLVLLEWKGSSLRPLFIRAWIPLMKGLPSWPNHHPKALPTNAIQELGLQHKNFARGWGRGERRKYSDHSRFLFAV